MRWQMIDRFISVEPGVRAEALKTFDPQELLFLDHFPNFATVPGVLQIEMVAQVGGKCIRMFKPELLPLLGSVKSAKFYQRVEPGQECRISVEIEKLRSSYAMATGQVHCRGVKSADVSLMFAMVSSSVLGVAAGQDPIIAQWQSENSEVKL